ncbi:uncharacterized protein [Watersipora subatra]|uniref:uncharacterized protein isoform X2 n=1 Tax=Watersipora subatra TaxID=2589382 RepID=UPI00355C93B2
MAEDKDFGFSTISPEDILQCDDSDGHMSDEVHYQDTEITAFTIYTKISEEARKMAKYYGVFLPNGKRDLESMISRFEDKGDYIDLYSHLPAVIRIAENALGKEIIVLNDEGEIESFGREEKEITNESIVIVDFDGGFCGTHLSQHLS